MKTKLFSYVMAMAFLVIPLMGHAQSAIISEVAINNQTLATTTGNTTSTISFDIVNGRGIVTNARYGIELFPWQDGSPSYDVVADSKIFDESLNLAANSVTHKTVKFTPSTYLSGKYEVGIVIRNESGLTVAITTAGTLQLASSGSKSGVVIDPQSCYVHVTGEPATKKYTLDFGVDILPKENLTLECSAKNLGTDKVTLVPAVVTKYRTSYGDTVPTPAYAPAPVVLAANAISHVSIELPKPDEPQSYNAIVSLTNASGVKVSNDITAHWVLRGTGATIHNLTIDKSAYAAKETATVSFVWTGSADSFEGSRLGLSAPITHPVAHISLCGQTSDLTLNPDQTTVATPVVIAQDCRDPHVAVTITDGADSNGKVYATQQTTVTSTESLASFWQSPSGVGVGILILLVVIALIGMAYRHHRGVSLSIILAVFIIGGALSVKAQVGTAPTQNTYTYVDFFPTYPDKTTHQIGIYKNGTADPVVVSNKTTGPITNPSNREYTFGAGTYSANTNQYGPALINFNGIGGFVDQVWTEKASALGTPYVPPNTNTHVQLYVTIDHTTYTASEPVRVQWKEVYSQSLNGGAEYDPRPYGWIFVTDSGIYHDDVNTDGVALKMRIAAVSTQKGGSGFLDFGNLPANDPAHPYYFVMKYYTYYTPYGLSNGYGSHTGVLRIPFNVVPAVVVQGTAATVRLDYYGLNYNLSVGSHRADQYTYVAIDRAKYGPNEVVKVTHQNTNLFCSNGGLFNYYSTMSIKDSNGTIVYPQRAFGFVDSTLPHDIEYGYPNRKSYIASSTRALPVGSYTVEYKHYLNHNEYQNFLIGTVQIPFTVQTSDAPQVSIVDNNLTSVCKNVPGSYTLSVTYPDGVARQGRYKVVFSEGNTPTAASTTAYVPTSGTVSSSDPQTIAHAWLSSGTKQIQAWLYALDGSLLSSEGKIFTNVTDCPVAPPAITASCASTPSAVQAGDDFTSRVSNAAGGTGGPYTYNWSDGGGFSASYASSTQHIFHTNNSSGGAVLPYVSVKDSSGATAPFTCGRVGVNGANGNGGNGNSPTQSPTPTASPCTGGQNCVTPGDIPDIAVIDLNIDSTYGHFTSASGQTAQVRKNKAFSLYPALSNTSNVPADSISCSATGWTPGSGDLSQSQRDRNNVTQSVVKQTYSILCTYVAGDGSNVDIRSKIDVIAVDPAAQEF